jgi:hypothetical protein
LPVVPKIRANHMRMKARWWVSSLNECVGMRG